MYLGIGFSMCVCVWLTLNRKTFNTEFRSTSVMLDNL